MWDGSANALQTAQGRAGNGSFLGQLCCIKGTTRLISCLRHHQFGVLVTASAVGKQAYEEIHQERHRVVM